MKIETTDLYEKYEYLFERKAKTKKGFGRCKPIKYRWIVMQFLAYDNDILPNEGEPALLEMMDKLEADKQYKMLDAINKFMEDFKQ